jgi:Holliday junction resolvasome RuvABC endonuclease subunit
MPSVLGIDARTRSVDLVFLDENVDAARWHSLPLEKGIAGLRQIRRTYAWAEKLEDVYLVAIEDPFSAGKTQAKQLGRVCGAIVASLPTSIDNDAVWWMRPDEWRMACGLAGNASKADAAEWARATFPGGDIGIYSQDAIDALGVAYAARAINARAIAA